MPPHLSLVQLRAEFRMEGSLEKLLRKHPEQPVHIIMRSDKYYLSGASFDREMATQRTSLLMQNIPGSKYAIYGDKAGNISNLKYMPQDYKAIVQYLLSDLVEGT